MTKKIAMIVGVIFVIVGILGFVNNPILGIFVSGMMHSIVHLVSGIVLILASRKSDPSAAASALKILGVIYGLVTILGFASLGGKDTVSLLGLIDVNSADNWLHVALTLLMLWAGFSAPKSMAMKPPMGGMNTQM